MHCVTTECAAVRYAHVRARVAGRGQPAHRRVEGPLHRHCREEALHGDAAADLLLFAGTAYCSILITTITRVPREYNLDMYVCRVRCTI